MSNLDKDKEALEKEKPVFETMDVITTNVYKISPEEKEKLNLLAEERLEMAREEAISKIRERYDQRIKERRKLQQLSEDK